MSGVRDSNRVAYLSINEIGEESMSFSYSSSQNATEREDDEHEVLTLEDMN